MKELHRFANVPVVVADTMRWNVMQLWAEIERGLSIAAKKHGDGSLLKEVSAANARVKTS